MSRYTMLRMFNLVTDDIRTGIWDIGRVLTVFPTPKVSQSNFSTSPTALVIRDNHSGNIITTSHNYEGQATNERLSVVEFIDTRDIDPSGMSLMDIIDTLYDVKSARYISSMNGLEQLVLKQSYELGKDCRNVRFVIPYKRTSRNDLIATYEDNVNPDKHYYMELIDPSDDVEVLLDYNGILPPPSTLADLVVDRIPLIEYIQQFRLFPKSPIDMVD